MKNNIHKSSLLISSKKGVYSRRYDDIYFDKTDGIKEKEHVYLNANDLANRIQFSSKLCITELGFGTGLNFILTWRLWKKNRKPNSSLTYISFEKAPLSKKEMIRIYKKFNELNDFSNQLIQKLTDNYKTNRTIYFKSENINLILIYDDFSSLTNFDFKADVWFLDGFAPSKNPEAWDHSYYKHIYNRTNLRGSLSSFTSSGSVRRGLALAGFSVTKVSGFGKKREMLKAIKTEPEIKLKVNTNYVNSIGPVAIIGAGISGASLAYALRKRNVECYILEKSSKIANGASGNRLALQMPKMTADNSPYGLMSLEAFTFSRNLAKALKAAPVSDGLILLPSREREIIKFKKLLESGWPDDLIQRYTDKVNCFNIDNYIYMRSSGIVDNIEFIKRLIDDVKVFLNFNVTEIKSKKHNSKIIFDKDGHTLNAKTIIWANGFNITDVCDKIPVKPVSGQVTFLKSNSQTAKLKLNFSYGQFFSQSFKGYHQIGSSFNRNTNVNFNQNDQSKNLNSIPEFLKQRTLNSNVDLNEYRVSIRSSTKDRMPFFGNLNEIKQNNSEHEYVLGGMGAWGFVYAPYYAELMVRELLNENPIINSKLDKLLRINRLL